MSLLKNCFEFGVACIHVVNMTPYTVPITSIACTLSFNYVIGSY